MNKKLVTLLCILALLIAAFGVTAAAEEANAIAKIGDIPYDTLAGAIADVNTADPVATVITLQKPVTETVTFDKTVYLDLNGQDIGPVIVAEGYTLYCFDTATDDYQIEGDAETGYYGFGRLTVSDSEENKGEIVGVAAGEYFDNSYLKVTEGNSFSFHSVTLRIDTMTLRPQNSGETEYNPGMYYTSTFAGDQLVAENVEKFGIALSTTEEPDEENFGVTNKCSVYSNFTAGADGNANLTSTYVKSILKESNGRITNTSRAQMPIFGRAYAQTADGYIFGNGVKYSFQEMIQETANSWNDLELKDQQGILAMYKPYQSLMKSWSVDGIRNAFLAEEDKIVRILNISNSHGEDCMRLLPTVIATEKGPDYKFMVAECYFSGALTEHVANANNYAPDYIYYTSTGTEAWTRTENVTIEYALGAERWDYIMFNESSRHLGLESVMKKGLIDEFLYYIDYRLDYEPTLFYNMTWSNPTDDRFHDDELCASLKRRKAVENFKERYTKDYGYDYVNHYNFLVEKTEQYLADHPAFDKIMYTSAPVQYAQVRPDVENRVPQWDDEQIFDLYRDYTHLSDFARLMVAYQIYAQFFDLEEITEVNVDVVRDYVRNSYTQYLGDLEITEKHKQVILDCVNYSLKDPLLKSLTTTPVVQDGASEFVIVHDGTEGAITLANTVRDTIAEKFGVTLEVGSNKDFKENSVRQEIVVGNARGIAGKLMEELTGEFDFAVESRGNKLLLCAKDEISYFYLIKYLEREVLVPDENGDLVLDSSDNIIYSQSELKELNYIDYCQAAGETAASSEMFSYETYINRDTTLPYRLYVPFNYSPEKEYPVLIFLHGAGHRGTDNNSQFGLLPKHMNLEGSVTDEAIVIAPQCPPNNKWADTDWTKGSYSLADTPESNELKAVMEILQLTQEKYNVDDKRIYACGYSMGGYGTWNLLMNHPDVFCAGIPMCGAGDPAMAQTLAEIPIWAVHHEDDPTVPVSGSRDMYNAIVAAGGDKIHYTELNQENYPTTEPHNVWGYTFYELEIFDWLFSQVKE